MAQDFEKALQDEGLLGTPMEGLARSIYQQESGGGKNKSTSYAGARGGMQVMPATFSQYNPGGNIDNDYDNSVAGLRYIKDLFNKTGDLNLTAVGYYGGPGAISKAKRGVAVSDPRNASAPNTLEYARQVMGRTDVSRGTSSGESARPESVISDLGQNYQAAYALMYAADEPETERERTKREEQESAAEESANAQRFASLKEQLTKAPLRTAFAKPQQEQKFAIGGSVNSQMSQTNNPNNQPFQATVPNQFEMNPQFSGGVAMMSDGGDPSNPTLMQNPERWIANKIGLGQAYNASVQAPQEMGFSGEPGTQGDAVRHMVLMREIEKKYGSFPARAIGWGHEYIVGPLSEQSSRDREMDLANNALGLELSKQAGSDEAKFRQLMQDALATKRADYYRNEYQGKGVRKRAEGSPEEGEQSLGQTASQMWQSIKNPEHWKELGAGMSRAAQATPGVVESLVRGAAATVPGTPGDIESLGRMLAGSKEQYFPTTEKLLKATDKYRLFQKPEGAENLEEVGGWISPAAGPAVAKAGKGAARMALEDLNRAMSGEGGSRVAKALTSQVQPMYAVRPKGGVYLGARSANDPPLSQIDFDILEAIENVDESTPQGKAIVDFLDKKVRKYYQVDQGTPNDPIFKAIIEGRIQSREFPPEMVQRARQGDVAAYNELRNKYDLNTGVRTVYTEEPLKQKGIYTFEKEKEISKAFKDAIEKQRPGEPSFRATATSLSATDRTRHPTLYDFPGLNQMVKESESSKLLSLLNKSDLPPHLRQAARESEPVTYSFIGDYSINNTPRLADIKDYLSTRTPAEIKNMGYADVVAKTQEWHTMLEQARNDPSKFSKKQLYAGTEPYMNASNDMKWVDVKSSDALSLEGNIMGHCVGGSNYCNAVDQGTKKIISLRDKKGIPHVTVELAADNKNGIFDRVVQIKGTANNPATKYFPQIDDFLTQYQSKLGNTKLRITEADSYLPESWKQLGQQHGRAPNFRRVDDRGAWVQYQNQDGEMIEEYVLRGDPRFQDLNFPEVD